MMNKQMMSVAVLMLLVGAGVGYILAPSTSADHAAQSSQDAEKKVLFYRNPMNPAITSPVFTQDEMGMDYIAVYADGGSGGAPVGTVSIDATVVQNIGVRTTTALRQNLSHTVRTVGRVTYDETRVARLHPKYDGWVEKMFVEQTGDKVHKNTMLMSIYSPQLVASQEEYVLALNHADTLQNSAFPDVRNGALGLLESARERLELLDVPQHQIKQLEKTRKVMKALHIHSPFVGIVMHIGAREGQRITANTELYKIADLSRIWVIVDLYEDDVPWVNEGDRAEMTVAGIPGRTFVGKVSYIYPYLEAQTRTIKVRLEFENANLALKPEMFANVTIEASTQVDAVVLPSEAIIRTGAQEQVFVQREVGKYTPRKVVLGVESSGLVQIIEGIEAGEVVVTSSQFLIDSESKLKEATAKMMQAQDAESATTANQNDMQMEDMEHMDMGGMEMDSMDKQSMDMDAMNMEAM